MPLGHNSNSQNGNERGQEKKKKKKKNRCIIYKIFVREGIEEELNLSFAFNQQVLQIDQRHIIQLVSKHQQNHVKQNDVQWNQYKPI